MISLIAKFILENNPIVEAGITCGEKSTTFDDSFDGAPVTGPSDSHILSYRVCLFPFEISILQLIRVG